MNNTNNDNGIDLNDNNDNENNNMNSNENENVMIDHYLTYLKDIINIALKNHHHLFNTNAYNDLTSLLSMDENYLKILSRMIKRKGPWIRY